MARSDLSELYQWLTYNKFNFMKPGEYPLQEIYRAVKAKLPPLCDDSYLCLENCLSGKNQPEWMHIVRAALNGLKLSGKVIKSNKRSYWEFI
jgi:hypothetical protein